MLMDVDPRNFHSCLNHLVFSAFVLDGQTLCVAWCSKAFKTDAYQILSFSC